MAAQISEQKEIRILDAAQRRFASLGYSKVTMDEIAEEAGMAKASLYYYFPTKESVFRAVIEREQREFLTHAAKIVDQDVEAAAKLEEYVRIRLQLTKRLLNLNRLNQQAWREFKPLFNELFVSFGQEELRIVTHIVQQGKKQGEFTLEHPQKIALMLIHVLQGLRMRIFKTLPHASTAHADEHMLEQESLLCVTTMIHGLMKK